ERLADADFADAGAYCGQHDIHDSDAADQQYDRGDCQQNHGEDVRGALSQRDESRQVAHVVDRFGAMAALDDALDLVGGGLNHRRIGNREVDQLHGRCFHEIARHRVGHDEGVGSDFGLPEGVDALMESPDDGERQAAELDRPAHGSFRRTVDLPRKLVGNETDLVVSLLVLLIKEASGGNDQVPHQPVLGINTENLYVSLLAFSHRDAVGQSDYRRRCCNAGDLLHRCSQVVDSEGVLSRVGDALRAAFVLGVNFVGADSLNLIQDVLLAGEADSDHQDQRSGSDYHANRRQHETDFVAAEGVVSEAQNLAECELRRELRNGGGYLHR